MISDPPPPQHAPVSLNITWLIVRALLAAGAALLGAGVGHSVLKWLGIAHDPMWTALGGAVCAVLLVTVTDTVRGHRLLSWLAGPQTDSAPRHTGLWGELAYRMERSLRRRERLLAEERGRLAQFLSAIEASPNGVLLLDELDGIEWCNHLAADHFSLNPVRDRAQRITNLVRQPDFVNYLHAGQFEQPLLLTDPRKQIQLSVIVRAYGQGGRLVLSMDVTERERIDAMRRDFIANVSHEIRTPLTVVAGFLETLSTLRLTEPERVRVLTLMQQQTLRMQGLVADLLTLAKLEGRPRPAPDTWVSLDDLLLRVCADAQALSNGGHALVGPAEPTLMEVAGIEAELHSAISNLATNAVRYTPVGGTVTIAWQQLSDGNGEISVTDTGPGIPREHLPRLTERFYRLDSSRSRETGGTGLGLSIVKHVVQRHGGELMIHSEVGKGSRFRIVLPAARVRHTHAEALGAEAHIGALSSVQSAI